jgi:hypothetical protein
MSNPLVLLVKLLTTKTYFSPATTVIPALNAVPNPGYTVGETPVAVLKHPVMPKKL